MIEFTMRIIPPKTTSQQKRAVAIFGKGGKYAGIRFFKGKKVEQASNDLASLMLPYQPPAPLDGPLCLHLTFTWPWRKSESKKRMALGSLPMDTRPDVDNLAKLCMDNMVKLGFMGDDGQVAELRVRKFWGDLPGIRVVLYSIVDEVA